MHVAARLQWVAALLMLIMAAAGMTGCAAVGFVAAVGCEVVTAGNATEDCTQIGQAISAAGD